MSRAKTRAALMQELENAMRRGSSQGAMFAKTVADRAGMVAQVFEAWPHSTGIGGGLQIAPNGMHVLDEIGVASELMRRGSICESIDFYSQAGTRLGSVNRNMVQRFGQPSVSMPRAVLHDVLTDKTWSSCVELYFEKRLARIEDRPDQPIVAHFTDGSSAEGDFLIGADGVHSAVRDHVVPDAPKPFDTGLLGFGGFVPRPLLDAAGAAPGLAMTFGQSGFRLRLLQPRFPAGRDVLEHPAGPRHRCGDLPRDGSGRAETTSAAFPCRLARSDPATDRRAGGDRRDCNA